MKEDGRLSMFVWVRIHACVKACHDQEMNKKKLALNYKVQACSLVCRVCTVYEPLFARMVAFTRVE